MTPLTPEARKQLLDNPPPEREDEFPHLATLTPAQLLNRRVEVTEQLKHLELERTVIDEELMCSYSEAELKKGLRIVGVGRLNQRQRSSWTYDEETKAQIRSLQCLAQHNGSAQQNRTTYLVLTRDES
jgi:hypothetical protein